jgi:hypothetical protein
VAGKFMGNSHVDYKIIVDELNLDVTRRYQDFAWLRESLVKSCPGCVVFLFI